VADADGAQALSHIWSYHSKLTAYQKKNSDLWYIAWQPDVLAPNLTATTQPGRDQGRPPGHPGE